MSFTFEDAKEIFKPIEIKTSVCFKCDEVFDKKEKVNNSVGEQNYVCPHCGYPYNS